jgi:hypothetical protein
MPTFYLGKTADGRVVSRKSTNPAFTHAAITAEARTSCNTLPNFSTSPDGAVRNFYSYWRETTAVEVVELRKVDAAEFRAATKGINPRTGLPS